MELEQAIEMTEALSLDNEQGITTLGSDGDEVATLLLEAFNDCENQRHELEVMLIDTHLTGVC